MAPTVKDVNGNDGFHLQSSLEEVNEAMHLFFANHFNEAASRLEPKSHHDIYHSAGLTMIKGAHACFTMEKPLLKDALISIRKCAQLCETYRKPASITGAISGWFTKTDYNEYSDVEAHAELLSLVMNFFTPLASFLSEQSLTSLIRGIKCFYSAQSSAKLCHQLLLHKTRWESESVKSNFDCGALLCWGMMNLVFHHLPGMMTKVLFLAGLTSDRRQGLEFIERATSATMRDTMLYKMACLYVCFQTFYAEQMLGVGQPNLDRIRRITEEGLKQFPDGAFDLHWSARAYQMAGNYDKAIELFNRSITSQNEFKAMHNASRWDMLWCHAIQFDWVNASVIADHLRSQCKWSPCTNTYQYACFMYMRMEDENRPELRQEVDKAMKQVCELRKRYIGKTLPPEKFAVTMAERYNNGETDLVLPVLMLFYIWNVLENCLDTPDVLMPVIERIDKKLEQSNLTESRYVLLLIKGACLRSMSKLEEAYDCFTAILEAEEDIIVETYVPPQAAFELGMTFKAMGDYEQAKEWLTRSRDSYTGFLAEAFMHMRIHGALSRIRELRK